MAIAEELCESEVLWPEAPHDDDGAAAPPGCSSSTAALAPRSRTPARRGVPEAPRREGSRLVDIPRPAARSAALRSDDGGGGGFGRSGTMVPPHVLVSRRRSEGAAAFALRSGPGPARELSHLRHSVLRMTGFIEG
ncbi:uncharacterized protein C2845_PM08G24330 [Panicum miliaceum]|uniref:Uncharacterized protein n=1 Tax=Panicum miliaceum TaxID=4540 RepID=A0A3L6R293_PANMI|nr:uncharacterized protein C2845_PM08G24330 [Panicum miliaceum]